MKLLRFLFSLLLIGIGISAFAYFFLLNKGQSSFEDKENFISQELDGFEKIVISGGFNVELKKGNSNELLVEKREILDQIEVKVRNRTLYIESDQKFWNMKKYDIALIFRDLEEFHIQGAAHVETQGSLALEHLEMELSGASEVYLELDVEDLQIHLNGMSSANLWGEAKRAEIKLAGAGTVNALDMETKSLKINLAGAGSADVHAKDYLKIQVAGAGRVAYKGSPEIDQQISGAGSIKRLE